MYYSNNDSLIEEIINSPLFIVKEDGCILAKKRHSHYNHSYDFVRTTPRLCGEYHYLRYKNKNLAIHRIVYRKFNGTLGEFEINHKDGVKLNNHYKNLELVTSSQNKQHMHRILKKRCYAKIDLKTAEEIRNLIKCGIKQRIIAKKYNLHQATISHIKNEKYWNEYKYGPE